MLPQVINLRLDMVIRSPIVLALDADEETWPRIYKKACDLLKAMSGRIEHIFFLGSSRRYPVAAMEFPDQAPAWFRDNINRASLINPVFSGTTHQQANDTYTVLCSRPPIDLADWQDSEKMARTLFITPETDGFPPGVQVRSLATDTGRLCELLQNAISDVCLQGTGFLPLRWNVEHENADLPGFQDGIFSLPVPLVHDRVNLHVQGIGCGPEPCLHIRHRNGNVGQLPLEQEQEWFPPLSWQKIPSRLEPVFTGLRNRENYTCPQCGQMHKYTVLSCPQGSHVLQGIPLETWILFNRDSYLSLDGMYAHPLRNKTRAVTRHGELFDYTGKHWAFVRQLHTGDQVDEDIRAFFNSYR